MMTLLSQAFALAASCHHTISDTCTKIHDAYDRMGCFVWRAMMDDQFLAMKTTEADSKLYRQTAGYYDWGKHKAAGWVYETLALKGASGDLSPKPDIKPGLINAAQAGLPYLTRVNWTSPIMIGAVFLAVAAAAYVMTHTGSHSAADTIGTIYGAAPGTPRPKND